jgi:hypothetical protein
MDEFATSLPDPRVAVTALIVANSTLDQGAIGALC